jgi:hypothetical protein
MTFRTAGPRTRTGSPLGLGHGNWFTTRTRTGSSRWDAYLLHSIGVLFASPSAPSKFYILLARNNRKISRHSHRENSWIIPEDGLETSSVSNYGFYVRQPHDVRIIYDDPLWEFL